jgi:hypothetical protein
MHQGVPAWFDKLTTAVIARHDPGFNHIGY